MGATKLPGLSKSRFLAGLQCSKRLWWTVHEPDREELAPDEALQRVLDRGSRIGAIARKHVPGGILIDLPHHRTKERVAATSRALAGGARVIYEASFLEDGVFVSVDILERRGDEFVLTEVKSTLDVKPEHLPDVAIQLHVLRKAGLQVRRAEVMHLNRQCRYPDLSNLFLRKPVTRRLRALLAKAPTQVAALRSMLARPVPEVPTGSHCRDPYECPFLERCWPPLPDHHVSTLHRIRSTRVEKLLGEGLVTIRDLPSDAAGSGPAQRQIRAVQRGKLVVERGLRRALSGLRPPLAYLDFETINPAIPVWPGCAPYEQVPVQLSCHVRAADGTLTSHGWLPEGSADPRRLLAERLLSACSGARSIVAYNASFEERCIAALAAAAPELGSALSKLAAKLVDLLPIVRDHVYHPEFRGSFSLKPVVAALVPKLDYGDLEIQDGESASAALELLLLEPESCADEERESLREALLRYCERDTLAMVRLHERLGELASGRVT